MTSQEHERLQHQIPVYLAGRLEESSSHRLEVHLVTCTDCQDLVECGEYALRAISEQIEPGTGEHPETPALKAHAEKRANAGDRTRIEKHLGLCADCSAEVASWGSGRVPGPDRVQARPTSPLWRPMVTGILVGVAATLIVAFIWSSPSRKSPGGTGWDGTTEWVLLEDPSRGGPTRPVARAAPGQSVIPFLLVFSLPPEAGPSDVVSFGIRGADGARTWDHSLPVAEIRLRQRKLGFVPFLIPVEPHPPGTYTWTLITEGRESVEPFMEIPFEIVP